MSGVATINNGHVNDPTSVMDHGALDEIARQAAAITVTVDAEAAGAQAALHQSVEGEAHAARQTSSQLSSGQNEYSSSDVGLAVDGVLSTVGLNGVSRIADAMKVGKEMMGSTDMSATLNKKIPGFSDPSKAISMETFAKNGAQPFEGAKTGASITERMKMFGENAENAGETKAKELVDRSKAHMFETDKVRATLNKAAQEKYDMARELQKEAAPSNTPQPAGMGHTGNAGGRVSYARTLELDRKAGPKPPKKYTDTDEMVEDTHL